MVRLPMLGLAGEVLVFRRRLWPGGDARLLLRERLRGLARCRYNSRVDLELPLTGCLRSAYRMTSLSTAR